MLKVLVDEATLYGLEDVVHAFQHQVMPVGRQTQQLSEDGGLEFDECDGDLPVKHATLATKLDAVLGLVGSVLLHNHLQILLSEHLDLDGGRVQLNFLHYLLCFLLVLSLYFL